MSRAASARPRRGAAASRGRQNAELLVIWLPPALALALWLALDCRPPAWDQAGHLTTALHYARGLAGGPWELLRALAEVPAGYPPFYSLSVGALFALAGPRPWLAGALNIGLLGLLVGSILSLGRSLHQEAPWVGRVAAALAASSPFLLHVAHEALLDLALTATVAAAAALLVGGALTSAAGAGLAGAAVAGACLVKPTALLFLAGPAGWSLRDPALWRPGGRRRLALFALAAAVPVAGWAVLHATDLEGLVRTNLGAAALEGDPRGLAAGLGYYLHGLYRLELAPLVAWLLVPGVVLGLVAWRRLLPLWLWTAIPWLVLGGLLPNKDFRYMLPALPAILLLGAGGLRAVPWPWPRRAVAGAVLAVAGSAALAALFGPAAGPAWWLTFRGPLSAPALRLHPVAEGTPACEDWQGERIVRAAARRQGDSGALVVGVVPSMPELNASTVRFLLLAGSLEAEVRDLAAAGPEGLKRCHLLVTKEGRQGPAHATPRSAAVQEAIQQNPYAHPLVEVAPLPDGTRLMLRGGPGARGD